MSVNFRVRTNVEIWQRRSLRAAAAPVFQEYLCRDPAGGIR